jgi:hypothetical protein
MCLKSTNRLEVLIVTIQCVGHHPKKGRIESKFRNEGCRLGDDLDLNRVLISRDYSGKVIVEELWNC